MTDIDLCARLERVADSFRDQVIAIDTDSPTALLLREAAAEIEGLRRMIASMTRAADAELPVSITGIGGNCPQPQKGEKS